MLKVGLPRDAIKAKMQHEGMNPAYLDKNPSDMIPLEGGAEGDKPVGPGAGTGPMVPVSEHPLYNKYFKMMKVKFLFSLLSSLCSALYVTFFLVMNTFF
jgi:hypothetical protein